MQYCMDLRIGQQIQKDRAEDTDCSRDDNVNVDEWSDYNRVIPNKK